MTDKKIKRIAIKVEASGNGIINFDSNDQKYIWNKVPKNQKVNPKYNNVSFSKKDWYGKGDDFDYKIKISGECIKNAMFKDDVHSFSPSLQYNSNLFMTYLTSESIVSRGYLFANDKESIKRKGTLCLTSFTQTNNAVSTIEIGSRGGEKIKKISADDSSDTSLFFRETIGDVKYSSDHVSIDLCELQFICGDTITDRLAVSVEDQKKYIEYMRNRYGNDIPDFELYKHATSSDQIPEIGIMLPNDVTLRLAKHLLRKILGFEYYKTRAFIKTDSVKIKLISDPLDHIGSEDEDWITLTPEIINNLDFEVYQQYIRCEDQLTESQIRESISKRGDDLKNEKIANKTAQREKLKSAKLDKDNEKENA